MKRNLFLHATMLSGALAFTTHPLLAQNTTEPIKVGILHSLSGTMAISETSLKDVALTILLVEQYYDFAHQLADSYVVMERGEIVATGLGCNMEQDGVREMISV